MGYYQLQCQHPECGKVYQNDDFRLFCDREQNGEHSPSLLKSIYKSSKLNPRNDLPGIFKYIDWLPCQNKYLNIDGLPLVYKSEGLAKHLGLSNLWILFSGFWPARGGDLLTRSFKQLEAPATIIRYLLTRETYMPLLISSAGNTANAFNYVCNALNIPLFFVVPLSGLRKLRLPIKTNPFSIAVKGDYSDAIELANTISRKTGLFREGGVRNIARRDGMGVGMLEAVNTAGNLFDHYFQAVGSGSGAIAAWESIKRLQGDGTYGNTNTKFHLIQNKPFTPLVDSWKADASELVNIDEFTAKKNIENVIAEVLTNRQPPYSISGGVRDVLKNTNGCMYAQDNASIFDAARKFRAFERIDIGPAAAAATSAMIEAVEQQVVSKSDNILLHITGGGFEAELERFREELYEFKPDIIVEPEDLDTALEFIGKVRSFDITNNMLHECDME